MAPPFHLAIPVFDLETAVAFYQETFGCALGRRAERWADLNFYGHQLSLHLVDAGNTQSANNQVDGHAVPSRHFGVILPWDDWHTLSDRLKSLETSFLLGPYLRFEGEVGEQATMFLKDPSGNALEFKSFKDPTQIFAH